MSTITPKDIIAHDAARIAMFFQAYKECSPSIQKIVDEMTEIIVDENVEFPDKQHAIDVMVEALFPALTADDVKRDELLMNSREAVAARKELNVEESGFAEKLRRVMDQRGLTQEQLAKLTGVGQPAISNMLNRNCRPQQATIAKLAAALELDPTELWSGRPTV